MKRIEIMVPATCPDCTEADPKNAAHPTLFRNGKWRTLLDAKGKCPKCGKVQ